MRASSVERRWIALIRSRLMLLAVPAGGCLAIAVLFALLLDGNQRGPAIMQMVAFACALVTLILAHGMISADIRSGVAMVWLQKPVRPVPFFAIRAAEVTALATALVLSLWGVGAALVAWTNGPDAALELLHGVPGVVLLVVCACTLTFALSAWGVPTDSLLALLLLIGGTFWLLTEGPFASAVEGVAVPVDAIAAFVRGFSSTSAIPFGQALWQVGRFLVVWGLIGVAGLVVTTRSPLPRDLSR